MSRAGSFPLARVVERLAAAGALAPGTDAPADVELRGVSHDSRTVGGGRSVRRVAGRGARRSRLPRCGGAAGGGGGVGGDARPGRAGAATGGARRTAGGRARRRRVLRQPVPRPLRLRGHGHQRQDHDHAAGPPSARGRRAPPPRSAHSGLVDAGGAVRPRARRGLTTPGPVQLSPRGSARSRTRACASWGWRRRPHALDQRRLDGVRFDAVAYTNLSRDHLDYHPDMGRLPGGQGARGRAGGAGGNRCRERGRPRLGFAWTPARAAASATAWTRTPR